MKRATASAANLEDNNVRVTRARAKALGLCRKPMKRTPKPDENRFTRANGKADGKKLENATAYLHNKGRAVLKDVTNVICRRHFAAVSNASKVQAARKKSKESNCVPREISENPDCRPKIAEDALEVMEVDHLDKGLASNKSQLKEQSQSFKPLLNSQEALLIPCKRVAGAGVREFPVPSPEFVGQSATKRKLHEESLEENSKQGASSEISEGPSIVDIDSNQNDPLACIQYAQDIYEVKRVLELNHRPSTDYMETVQQEITHVMRGILIDWLVEVSEEFDLVPDTLYLTVNLIDRFLSGNYIEKSRLQLLGVTCMLIASKYEEIRSPRVEELCQITANTYTKDEVVKMERHILNFLCYQLSVPTTKTFLRRFVQAAQATSEVPSLDLEYLANYLAELTLIDYSFLKYLPSLIAASAVFLARWTIDQSSHPWNPTLEHYTWYKAQDLKAVATNLQDLQSNTSGCPLTAIRNKYRQQKFKCVATLSPKKPVQSLF